MTRRLIIRPPAESDVADAVSWYEDQRTGLGNELLDELDSVTGRGSRESISVPAYQEPGPQGVAQQVPLFGVLSRE